MSLNFTHIKGDTFEAVNFAVKVNTVAMDLTGAIIRMQLRRKASDLTYALALTSIDNAGITINDAVGGLFKINKQIINIEPCSYVYDIEIKLADGTVKTYVKGNFIIQSEVTR